MQHQDSVFTNEMLQLFTLKQCDKDLHIFIFLQKPTNGLPNYSSSADLMYTYIDAQGGLSKKICNEMGNKQWIVQLWNNKQQ